MAITNTTEDKSVQVKASNVISLTIEIGNSQLGSSLVFFKNDPKTILGKEEITNLRLGKGKELAGKILRVITNTSITGPTQTVVITDQFKNGTPPEFEYKENIDPHDVATTVRDYLFTL